jgi:hypothetical protein
VEGNLGISDGRNHPGRDQTIECPVRSALPRIGEVRRPLATSAQYETLEDALRASHHMAYGLARLREDGAWKGLIEGCWTTNPAVCATDFRNSPGAINEIPQLTDR